MSRLIDVDKLIKRFEILRDEHETLSISWNALYEILVQEPTAFDTEKVIAELESEKRYGSNYDSYYEENLYRGEMFENDVNNKTIHKSIDIVKKGGVE